MALSSPMPGYFVCWEDTRLGVKFRLALIIRVEEHINSSFYVLTIIQDERIKSLTLAKDNNGKSWRVLSVAA